MTAPEQVESVGYLEMCATGLSYRRLDYWTRCGYLRLANHDTGSGYAREWLATELPVAFLMVRLTDAGVMPEAAERVARGGELAPGLRIVFANEAAS